MKTVLIVDDESLVRQSIRHRVHWEDVGCEVVGEADNGLQALQLLKIQNVDIVITDLKMPIMDGICLIQTAKEQHPTIDFIILSGFPDFQHAKTAMQLGVKNFIEKPIDIAELEHTLYGISRQQQRTYAQLLEQASECGLFDYAYDCMSVVQYKTKPAPDWDTVQLETLLKVEKAYLFSIPHLPLCRFVVFASNLPVDLLPVKFLYYVSETLGKQYGRIFVFSEIDCQENFAYLFHRLMVQLQRKLFSPKLGMVPPPSKQKSRLNALKACIASNKRSVFLSLFDAIFADCFQVDIQMVETLIFELSAAIRSAHRSSALLPTIQELNDPYLLANMFTFAEMHDHLRYLFLQIFEHLEQAEKSSDILVQICQFIDENFDANLSLGSISNDFFLSSSYLSSLFKKGTGITITHYIESVRMEQAKQLLQNYALSINDIALSVGYSDPNYFGKVFKKHILLTPTQFRSELEHQSPSETTLK